MPGRSSDDSEAQIVADLAGVAVADQDVFILVAEVEVSQRLGAEIDPAAGVGEDGGVVVVPALEGDAGAVDDAVRADAAAAAAQRRGPVRVGLDDEGDA